MKICVIVPSLQEKGPVIVAENIAKYTQNKATNYFFISLRKNSQKDKEKYCKNNYKVYEIGMRRFPTIKDIIKLNKTIKIENPDIIHTHSFWPTIICSRFFNKYKLITTLHNNPIEDFSYEYGSIIGLLMTKTLLQSIKKFDKLVAISEYVKLVHDKMKVNKIIDVIYNGIEDKYIYNVPKKMHINENTLNIISISVLNKRKNIKQAIEIVNMLVKHGYKVSYKIIGDGCERMNLETMVSDYNLQRHISFTGNIIRSEVFNYINDCDVLIFPSLSEGFGLSVVEAMMMKKAVVCSNIDVMKEIVTNEVNGFICSNNDEFVGSLIKLIQKDILEKISSEARRKYLEKFTVERMANEYCKIYKEMMDC